MAGCFVRALFGDRRIPNFASVLGEVKWCVTRPHQPEPTLWYVWGEENADHLRSLGIEPTLMDPQPFSRFGSAAEEQAHHYQTIRYGSTMWRHKYPGVRHALGKHPACVWLDLDTALTGPLPPDFWERMGRGACFQATLQQNFRKRAGHRVSQSWPGKASEDEDSRKTPAGACLYFRGFEAIDALDRLYAERPFEFDLHVLARLTDELMGGWKGWKRYKELGFEPYCHSLGRSEKRQSFKPEDRLFVTEWRKPRLTRSGPTEMPYMLASQFPEKGNA